MHHIGYYFGISKQIELLVLTFIGIGYTFFNCSMSDLNINLKKIWELELDNRKISEFTQIHLKYLLSGIVFIKTGSIHINFICYIVMLWPIIFEERPLFFIPWLMFGAVRYITASIATFLCGIFTCISYNALTKPSCADFVVAMIIDCSPSFYLWFLVLSYYHELKKLYGIIEPLEPSKTSIDSDIVIRRRKVRSMADSIIPKHYCQIDEDRQLISVSTIENIVQQLTTDFNRKTTRSLDSLLGVKAAEAEKEELMNLCEELPNDETGLTIQEKTMKLFKLTNNDVAIARQKLEKTDCTKKNFVNIGKEARESIAVEDTSGTKMESTSELRFTQSENVDNELSGLTKWNTNFMTDTSETEIRSVLNYSSISLLPSIGLDNASLKSCFKLTTSKHKILKKKSSRSTVVNNKIRPKTSDFSCQASTLSRSILKTPPVKLMRHEHLTISPKKISTRARLEEPSESKFTFLKTNATEMTGHYKLLVQKDLITSLNEDDPVVNSSFKTDGYAMAYRKKGSIDKNLIRLARDVLMRRMRVCTQRQCEN